MGRLDPNRQVELNELLAALAVAESVSPDDPVVMYIREIAPLEPLQLDREADLIAGIRRGDEASRYRLTELNLWEVVLMARQFIGRGVSFLDLVQEGNLGLMRAVSEAPPGRDRSLTYAMHESGKRSRTLSVEPRLSVYAQRVGCRLQSAIEVVTDIEAGDAKSLTGRLQLIGPRHDFGGNRLHEVRRRPLQPRMRASRIDESSGCRRRPYEEHDPKTVGRPEFSRGFGQDHLTFNARGLAPTGEMAYSPFQIWLKHFAS